MTKTNKEKLITYRNVQCVIVNNQDLYKNQEASGLLSRVAHDQNQMKEILTSFC